MSRASDSWYVRFPDGRVMRANSTAAVRHHLEAGRIPSDSRVRRSSDEEWTALDWTSEFSDLELRRPVRGTSSRATSPRDPVASSGETGGLRSNSMQLQTVGVRGLAEELLAAMDSTLVRSKLVIAALAGFLGGLAFVAANLVESSVAWAWLPWAVAGLVCLVLVACCAAVLTQMTFVEVSRLRPARWAETKAGLGRHVFRLLIAQLLVGGTTIAGLVFLQQAPSWAIGPQSGLPPPWVTGRRAIEVLAAAEWLAAAVTAVALILQVLLWPVLGFALLLAPVILIEECSVVQALRIWWSLLRRHLSRVFLYEALACALAGVASLPFVVPVALSLGSAPQTGLAGSIAEAVLILLTGLALTPLIAFLFVANVFIFLNLRYEHTPLAR